MHKLLRKLTDPNAPMDFRWKREDVIDEKVDSLLNGCFYGIVIGVFATSALYIVLGCP